MGAIVGMLLHFSFIVLSWQLHTVSCNLNFNALRGCSFLPLQGVVRRGLQGSSDAAICVSPSCSRYPVMLQVCTVELFATSIA